MSTISSSAAGSSRLTTLGRGLEFIAIAAMALMALYIVLTVTGPNVLDVRPSFSNLGGGDELMAVRGEVDFPVNFGDRLSWIDTEDGTRDAATGQAPVELGGPVTAQLSFWAPTASQRAAWTIRELLGPAMTIAGVWLVFGIVRSARRGDPFTADNERRLWSLAALVAVGGILYSMVIGFTTMLLIQRSAAADLFVTTATISLLPLVMGALLAMLALVWRIGVGLRDDVEGTI